MSDTPLSKKSSTTSIHPATRMGHVSLTVNNLDNQVAFYKEKLGLRLHWQDGDSAGMGAGGEDLIRMVQDPKAKRYSGVTGLYHFAFLYPNRRELARGVARLFHLNVTNYPTDHILTKTTYLNDPEGNGIELYTESPEDGEWFMEDDSFSARRSDGSPSNGREPLDVKELLSHLKPDDRFDNPISEETRIGHVHLHVAEIADAVYFYHDLIGFDIMGIARRLGVAFVSAGGYHHHLGLNTWQGVGAPAPPEWSLGLRYFSILLPDQIERDRILTRLEEAGIQAEIKHDDILVQDPSQNRLLLVTRLAELN